MTNQHERCKNRIKTGSKCYLHQSQQFQQSSRDDRLANILVAGASIIAILEKAIEHLPSLFSFLSINQSATQYRPTDQDQIQKLTSIISTLDDLEDSTMDLALVESYLDTFSLMSNN